MAGLSRFAWQIKIGCNGAIDIYCSIRAVCLLDLAHQTTESFPRCHIELLCRLLTSSRETATKLLPRSCTATLSSTATQDHATHVAATHVLPDWDYIIAEHQLNQTENNLCELVLQTKELVHSFHNAQTCTSLRN